MKVLATSHFGLRAVRSTIQPLRILRRNAFLVAASISAVLMFACTGLAQQEGKPKLPGIDKIIAANEHLAFTGTIKLVDEKHNTLSVNSVEGGDTEFFPIKHGTRVETSDGFRKKLEVLSPGTRVIVYYDQHADHRVVTRIELFASESKKREPQP